MRNTMLLILLVAGLSVMLLAAGFEPSAQKGSSVIRPVMWWPDLKVVTDKNILPDKTVCLTEANEFNEEWSRLGFASKPPYVNFKEYVVVVAFRSFGLEYGFGGGLEVDAKGNAKVFGDPIYPHADSDRLTYSTTIGVFPRRGITTIDGHPVSSPPAAPVGERRSGDSPRADQWVDSDDRTLALRLSASSQVLTDGNPIKITAQIRNNGQTPITVLRPFGDRYVAEAAGIKIWDDKRRIRYSGETLSYQIGASAFAIVAPGETIEDQIELSNDNFAGIEALGTYSLRYDYSYDGCWDTTAAAGETGIRRAWRGTITSREVRVTRR